MTLLLSKIIEVLTLTSYTYPKELMILPSQSSVCKESDFQWPTKIDKH